MAHRHRHRHRALYAFERHPGSLRRASVLPLALSEQGPAHRGHRGSTRHNRHIGKRKKLTLCASTPTTLMVMAASLRFQLPVSLPALHFVLRYLRAFPAPAVSHPSSFMAYRSRLEARFCLASSGPAPCLSFKKRTHRIERSLGVVSRGARSSVQSICGIPKKSL